MDLKSFLSINNICLKHFETITFQYLGNGHDVSDIKMFFVTGLGNWEGNSFTVPIPICYTIIVHDTTIDLLNHCGGRTFINKLPQLGKDCLSRRAANISLSVLCRRIWICQD